MYSAEFPKLHATPHIVLLCHPTRSTLQGLFLLFFADLLRFSSETSQSVDVKLYLFLQMIQIKLDASGGRISTSAHLQLKTIPTCGEQHPLRWSQMVPESALASL